MLDPSNSLDNNSNNNNHISSPGINLPSNITSTGTTTTTTTNSNAPIVLSSINSSQNNNNSSISSFGMNPSLPISNVNNLNFPRLNSIIEDSSYNFPSRRSSLYLGADFHVQSNQNFDPLHAGNQNNNIFGRRDSMVYPRYSFDSSSTGMIPPSNSIINSGSSAPYQASNSFIPGQENLAYDIQREYSFVYPSNSNNNNNNNQFSGLGQTYSSERILHSGSSNHMFSGRRASEQLDPFITPSSSQQHLIQQQQSQSQAQSQDQDQDQTQQAHQQQPQQQQQEQEPHHQQQQQQSNVHLPQQQYQQVQQMQQIPQALRSNSFLFKRISSVSQPMDFAPNDIELFLKRDNSQKMFESTDILDSIPSYNDQHQSPHILPSQSKLPLQSRTGSTLSQSLLSLPSRVNISKPSASSGNSLVSGSRVSTQMQQLQHVSTPFTLQPQSYAQSPTHSWEGIKPGSNELYSESNPHQISKTISNPLSGDISPSTVPENISDANVKIEEIPSSNLSSLGKRTINDSDAISILNSTDSVNGNKKAKINGIPMNETIEDSGSEFKSINKFKSNLVPEHEPSQNEDGRPLIGATKVDQLMLVIQARKKGIKGNIKQAADGSILEEIGDNGRTVLPSPMELVGGVEKPNIRGRKQHQCQYCLKKFTQSTHLEVHIRSHMGLKPYECSYCGKRFTQGGNLRTHLRLHTGEKPFKCSLCGKLFSRKGNLQAHTLTHENLKPFQCKFDNCNKSFTQLGNLKAHQNRFHMATLNELTNKLAQISSSESFDLLPEKERELLLYFSNLYKNLNKGIKGRGKTHLNDGDDNSNDEKIMDADR